MTGGIVKSLKEKLGCLWHERWPAELAMALPTRFSWLDLCNRAEHLVVDPLTNGRVCQWRDSSRLTLSRVFPQVGRRLFDFCFQQWPIELCFQWEKLRCETPDASVLIAIGGTQRLEQFKLVLAALRAQSYPQLEIIVVEQSETPELAQTIPPDVRYFHMRKPSEREFNKSSAINTAAELARGQFVIIHDADYIVPRDYVKEVCKVLRSVDAVRPGRLAFHMAESSTRDFIKRQSVPSFPELEFILQNNPTPMALTKTAYWEIGGHDEIFEGWGGEDTEFVSRMRTRKVAEGGWLPTIHLWHPLAPKKASGHRNQSLQDERMAIAPQERIRQLVAKRSTVSPS